MEHLRIKLLMILGEILLRVKYPSSPPQYLQLLQWCITALYTLVPLAAARLCSSNTGPVFKRKKFSLFNISDRRWVPPAILYYGKTSIGRYFPGRKAACGVACKNLWRCSPFSHPSAWRAKRQGEYSSKFRSLKKRTISCFEMSRSDFPVTQGHISEGQNFQVHGWRELKIRTY
jgi:hypothetical protein